jgi:hypothetical protein
MTYKRLHKLAYGKTPDKPGAGKLINWGSNVGTKIVQIAYFRSTLGGYKAGRGKK